MKNTIEILEKCNLCPHSCQINRKNGDIGNCKSGNKIKLALVSLHNYEEPCISVENGSGTIFFSNCNMHCIYCQNYEISQQSKGKEITVERLAEIFLEQQKRKAENINLVTPTTYVPLIIEAIKIAKSKGITIPFVYNTNSYENIETIKMLDGYIDIYLPDFKYIKEGLGQKYSKVKEYPKIAKESIKEMYKQVGKPKFDENGKMIKGVIIRHLILPGEIENTKEVLKWIKDNFDNNVYISVMAQYFPTYLAKENNILNCKITKKEYEEVENYLFSLELENGYIQELGEHEEEYVPDFNYNGI